jgi:hypothetical protein
VPQSGGSQDRMRFTAEVDGPPLVEHGSNHSTRTMVDGTWHAELCGHRPASEGMCGLDGGRGRGRGGELRAIVLPPRGASTRWRRRCRISPLELPIAASICVRLQSKARTHRDREGSATGYVGRPRDAGIAFRKLRYQVAVAEVGDQVRQGGDLQSALCCHVCPGHRSESGEDAKDLRQGVFSKVGDGAAAIGQGTGPGGAVDGCILAGTRGWSHLAPSLR